jgi:hypothetical protein
MSRKLIPVCLVLGLASGLAVAAPELWLHVHVEEQGVGGETVRVNVPFSLIESVLPLVDHEHLKDGKVIIPSEAVGGELDLRQIWEAVRETKDGEFVRVQGPEENVRVAKSQGLLLVEARSRDEKVDVRVPLEVVDALFSGDKDEIDVLAALRALERFPDHDIVTVDDGGTKVRIWVDGRQEMGP